MMNGEEIDGTVYTSGGGGSGGFWRYARKSLSTFLGLPLAIVLLFIIGAATIAWLDQSAIRFIQQLRQLISRYIFKTTDASGAVLGLIATGLLTMTSLVISMLLIALQQTAGNMGNLVYDQFMKRRRNQIYAGYIVGTEELIIRVLPSVDQHSLTRELDYTLADLSASTYPCNVILPAPAQKRYKGHTSQPAHPPSTGASRPR